MAVSQKQSIVIALAQMDIVWENAPINCEKVSEMIISAKQKKADLVVFPEMALSGFSLNRKVYGTEADLIFFKEIAKKQQIEILVGLKIKPTDESLVSNQAILFSKNGTIISQYKKIHLFSFAQEHKVIEAGKIVPISSLGAFKIATAICYDLRFPGIFEALAQKNTDIIFVIANWPDQRIEDWKTLLRARALDTQAFVVGVNRIGTGNGLSYSGYSSVYGPRGEKILEMTSEGVKVVTIESKTIREARRKFPSLADKRFDLYPKLNKK